ncbi:T9SS type A sorting domain-containing protein [Leptobacterium flavescens]|uniref:T9SS type A sorting domain-containing protein n=1 Tax=Leptobacterium flavescens TaxID=472055 RepID=A0A6P0UNL0_9FLAO|nr:T9SS type A sorting domain-containing protein [Leptobacterium flavescens]NER14040.1 T9SS type A sorting domain-containing protein [Leptobacterium flavescens]
MIRGGIILFFMCVFGVSAQTGFTEKGTLPGEVEENSGLIFYNNKLITHNDSGGAAELYEIDTLTNAISRTVSIMNATNVDWEDISQDNNYIYIGDIGNNSGSRTDLRIYRIAKSDYDAGDTVNADIISFSYEDQTDFTPSLNNTNWDAEALFVFDNMLVILTKEWIDRETSAYSVPLEPGDHIARNLGDFDIQGLVTGATYNPDTQLLYICGYSPTLLPFISRSSGLTTNNIFAGTQIKTNISEEIGFAQIEGIAGISSDRYMFSSERSTAFFTLEPKLFAFNTDDGSNPDEVDIDLVIFPNPGSDFLNFENRLNAPLLRLIIFDETGRKVIDENASAIEDNRLDISSLQTGFYHIKFCFESRTVSKSFIRK